MNNKQYYRKQQVKQPYNNNANRRRNFSTKNIHINSSLYGVPTIEEDNTKEETDRTTTTGNKMYQTKGVATGAIITSNHKDIVDCSSTTTTTTANSSHPQRQQPKWKSSKDTNRNTVTHTTTSTSGFQKVTVAIPGCKPQSFTVCVGNDPQDIQKWIQERRNNYPTRAKVLMKLQQHQIINITSNNDTTRNTPGSTTSTIPHSSNKKNNDPDDDNTLISSSTNHHPANALSSLMAGYDSSSSSSDGEEEEKENNSNNKSPLNDVNNNTLPSLEQNNIESNTPNNNNREIDSNNNNSFQPSTLSTNITITTTTATTSQHTASGTKKLCRYYLRGKCNRGNQCTFLHDDDIKTAMATAAATTLRDCTGHSKRLRHPSGEEDDKRNNNKKKQRVKDQPLNITNSNSTTLLRKLLHNDIQREACITLQLLRYIVHSNYFDPVQSNPK